ncbi:MAG: FtsX-like permease family protein [Mycoplasmoidaceae bacterium]|nr:FtsX-like permease family protein [Mycoplasmoidaceae bacterium]
MANDTSCTLNAAAFRIAYISSLVDKIDLISYLLTAFVLCLGLLISGIIVNRFINKNRVTIGVMQANGVGKWSIALSLIPFALLPSIIGGIAGYVLGTALQTFAISLFSAY